MNINSFYVGEAGIPAQETTHQRLHDSKRFGCITSQLAPIPYRQPLWEMFGDLYPSKVCQIAEKVIDHSVHCDKVSTSITLVFREQKRAQFLWKKWNEKNTREGGAGGGGEEEEEEGIEQQQCLLVQRYSLRWTFCESGNSFVAFYCTIALGPTAECFSRAVYAYWRLLVLCVLSATSHRPLLAVDLNAEYIVDVYDSTRIGTISDLRPLTIYRTYKTPLARSCEAHGSMKRLVYVVIIHFPCF